MDADVAQHPRWQRLTEVIADKIGLHFPPERQLDLERGLADAAAEFGFADATACADWLLSATLTRAQLHALAAHLTVGETYFFRERNTFEALAEHVFPELVRRRRGERHLRLWSVACCTGEEPYSLAILLRQCIPDWQDWRITLLATDINERFLQKAITGVYGEWSFRNVAPAFKEHYFTRTHDGRYALLPQIKQTVTFAPLNLAEDHFPSLATNTQAMDVIFCRNVLMYFTPAQARKVVKNLRHALVDDGWLIVSPSEGSHASFSDFAPLNFPGAILYQKRAAGVRAERTTISAPTDMSTQLPSGALESPFPTPQPPASVTGELPLSQSGAAASAQELKQESQQKSQQELFAEAKSLYQQGRYAEAAATMLASHVPETSADSQVLSLLARSLANQGKLDQALAWCDRWIAGDAVDSAGRYLRAMILQELGDSQEARRSLQQALYLDPNFVLAHFALGNLLRSGGKVEEARRHFAIAIELLRAAQPNDVFPEADGLTAARLSEVLASLLALEKAA